MFVNRNSDYKLALVGHTSGAHAWGKEELDESPAQLR
jgi:hypothetical protein